MMSSLPILLRNPRLLLVGGGTVALRKAGVLLDNQVEFKVVAEEYLDGFDRLDVEKVLKRFEAEDLNGYDFVIDATGDPSVAEIILHEKQQRPLLANFAANPEKSDFFFPALICDGELKIAVSTEGASPTISKFVRDRIKDFLPQDINTLLKKLAVKRKAGEISPEESFAQIEKLFAQNTDPRH